MRHGRVAVLAAALVAAGASGRGDDLQPDSVLDIVWIDVAGRAPFVVEAVDRELTAVLRPLGFATRLRVDKPGGELAPHEVSVVLMPIEAPRPLRQRGVMGAVQASPLDGRAAWVYLAEVMRALGRAGVAPGALDARGKVELGLALGRVVAHELVHLLAPRAPHAHDGLMAARLDRDALVKARPAVDASTRAAVAGATPVV